MLIVLVSPIWISLLLLYLLSVAILYLEVMVFWLPRGKDVLFVYSNSPNWQDYIGTNWLPRLRDRAVLLNWSERSKWDRWHLSLAVRCFYHFGDNREFNPMAVVFRPFRRARVFRFFRAFRDQKHGNTATLEAMEKAMFEYVRNAE